MRSMKFMALAIILALGGCGDDTKQVQRDSGPKREGGGGGDGPIIPTNSLLQTVVNKLLMPTNATEYTYDYGTGPKNKLGAISEALTKAGLTDFNFQKNVDSTIDGGTFILLFDVTGKSLTNEPTAGIQGYLGADTDTDPKNNFSGSATLKVKPDSPTNLRLPGKIASSKLTAGPGELVIPIPAGDDPSKYPQVSVKQCRIETVVADNPTSAMTAGKIFGVIPWSDVDGKILPAIQQSVNRTYKDPKTPAATVTLMKQLFDADGNGDITVDEIRNSGIIKLILAPDVDSDGDGKTDSMSVGMGFTAVKCVIQK